jgi:hypothetical protein
MGGGSNTQGSDNSGSNTIMDTLLKFITIDKLGVSLQHISEPSTTAQAIEAVVEQKNEVRSEELI